VTKTPDLIGSAEACELLGIDRATISRWVTSGRLKPAIQGRGTTGSRFYHRKDIEAIHNQREAEAAS
jgi:excisionase family DNA binding protein